MSDYIPFEIQSDIIKRLPVKSLVQFRSVSKQWKSFIDNPKFIKNYHTNPQHHLLVRYNHVPTYTSIIDDNTFPGQKFPLTAPEPLKLLKFTLTLGSVDGLLGFFGLYKETMMVVLWNPSVRKCVGIVTSNVADLQFGYTRIGFGVSSNTSDPKLVKINVVETPSIYWEVQVFTLSSRVWRTVYTGAPFKLCDLMLDHVFIDGVIYWRTLGSFIISFDLKSDKFGQVCLPERSIRIYELRVAKVNESLGLLEHIKESEMWVCGVWMKKDGVNKPFTKMYTIKVEGSQMEGYEPSSGSIYVGFSGRILHLVCGRTWKHYSCLISQILSFIDSEDGLQGVRIKL
ncbi:F-box domain containing protein [Tanacetum coccineum]